MDDIAADRDGMGIADSVAIAASHDNLKWREGFTIE